MKIKFIAAAVMAVCSSAAFAAVAPVVCVTSATDATATAGAKTAAENLVNTCAPEQVLYIGGSSALAKGVDAIAAADLFDTSVTPIIALASTEAVRNNAEDKLTQQGNIKAWYGMSKAELTGGASKRLFVVYNKFNGSAAGVSQMLAKFDPKDATKNVAEALVMSVGPDVKAGKAGTCVQNGAIANSLVCDAKAPMLVDIAISDVAPVELYKLNVLAKNALTTVVATPLALQGFGVAVSADLYAALQADQGLSASDKPSISRAAYASLVTGSLKSAAALIPGSTAALRLDRRDDLSGTQASSNIYFANNACGTNMLKGKPIKGVFGGLLPVIGTADSGAGLTVNEWAVGDDVITDLNLPGFAIGVIALGKVEPSASTQWKYVKLDGVSPIADARNHDALNNGMNRDAIASGDYGFAMIASAVTYAKVQKIDKTLLTNAVIAGLQNSNQHNLAGLAYIDGATGRSALQSKVKRTAHNNCSPLIKGL